VNLTLNRVILHTVVHHSSTSTYMPHFIETEEKILWTDGHTYAHKYVCTDGRMALLGRLGQRVDLKRPIIVPVHQLAKYQLETLSSNTQVAAEPTNWAATLP